MATRTIDDYRLQDILGIFVRWRLLALVAFLAVIIPGIAVSLLMPPMYEATATILVNRSSASPAFSVKTGQSFEAAPIMRSVNREEEVKTVAETIRTRGLIESTVAALDITQTSLNRIRDFRRYVQAAIDFVIDGAQWLWREFRYTTGLSTRPTPEEIAFFEREDLLATVGRRLRITPVPDTNILRVAFRSSDAALAQEAVNRIVTDFVNGQQRTDQASRAHFAEELRDAKAELHTVETTLAEFRGRMSAYSIATQRDLLLQTVERLRSDLTQLEALRAQRRAAADALRERLRADPQFQRDISKSLIDVEVEIAGLSAQLTSLRESLTARQQELSAINQSSVRLRELERDVARAEEAVALRQRNFEQARVTEGMSEVQLRDVRVVDLASYPLSPIRPRTLLYLGIALGAALLASIALPFVAHLNDTTLASDEDVARLLDLAFVASLPRLRNAGIGQLQLAGPEGPGAGRHRHAG